MFAIMICNLHSLDALICVVAYPSSLLINHIKNGYTGEAFAKPQRFSRNIALEHPWCIF